MKNKFIALALVTLSIATTTVSCTKDENPTDVKAQNVETTSVAFNVTAEKESNPTGKSVDRGSIPLYVDNLTINAVSSALTPFTATEQFSFNPNTASNLPAPLTLTNVALGTNVFNASSTSATTNKVLAMNVMAATSSLETMKNKTPYIPCFSINNPTAVIKKTNNAPVNLTMDTNNGRVIAKFVRENPDADNYKIVVNATVGNQVLTSTVNGATVEPNYQKAISFEWSNETAVAGAVVNFEIKIYEGDALLNTINKSITVQKAKSTLATYTIKNGDVHTDIEQGGILISFPTIGEVIINE